MTNTPTRRYELLKSLPDLDAGEIYVWCSTTGAYEPERFINIIEDGMDVLDNSYYWFSYRNVEKNTEWFRLIPEPSPTTPTTLQWEGFKEGKFTGKSLIWKGENYILEKDIPEWIKILNAESKQDNTKKQESRYPLGDNYESESSETEKFSASQLQNKERVYVTLFDSSGQFRDGSTKFEFHLEKPILPEKYPQIKQAIEQVLNNEPVTIGLEVRPNPRRYTEEDLKKAFEAGREQDFKNTNWKQHEVFSNVHHWDSRKYPTFQDYLKSIKQ